MIRRWGDEEIERQTHKEMRRWGVKGDALPDRQCQKWYQLLL